LALVVDPESASCRLAGRCAEPQIENLEREASRFTPAPRPHAEAEVAGTLVFGPTIKLIVTEERG